MKIAVSVESTADIPQEYIEKYDIRVIPFNIILDGEEFKDGTYSNEELFALVDKKGTLPKTTALNQIEYTEWFESILNDYDAVIHICISGGITSTVSHAEDAAKTLKNVYVVDSKSLSAGSGLLAITACELISQHKSPLEIKQLLEEKRNKIKTSFVIERLDYLYKGGRCNSLQLLGANIFKIRPKVIMKDGKMIMDKKFRGSMGTVVEAYGKDLMAEGDYDTDKVIIVYTSENQEMINSAKRAVSDMGFNNVYTMLTKATVSSHCGANTLGIMFYSK